jgi:chromosome segregation protein
MKIKRLEIIGFKSFVDKVVLDFPAGVTAVVGPNGCGKSNIVDAIRWVMGEQSAKNLRGRQMEDVIFGGSESRKPLGMAEVSLVFATDDGRVPAKYLTYSEIQVTRRLYRDGESEYLLNKTPCRLLDIAELFMDTGVGARAYSIIEQGRIGMILMAKPEERRFLIEEAAGVTKFKSRKQVALKKIETTRQNLLRIGDIVAEIRRQLNGLQRQAKKAERFRACREELKEIELLFASRRFATFEQEREQLVRELASLNDREQRSAVELTGRELALEEQRIVLIEEEKALNGAQEEIFRVKAELQGAENRREFQQKELGNLERQLVRLREELTVLEQQLAAAVAEARTLEEGRGAYGVEAADEEQALEVREQELAEQVTTERRAAAALEEGRRTLFALLGEIAQCANQQTTIGRRLEMLAEREERSRREALTLQERLVESQLRANELERGVDAERNGKAALQLRLTELRQREEGLKVTLAAVEQDLLASRDQLSRAVSRLHSLQELEAQLAGYGQGVRTLLLADRFKGRFQGLIADAVETSEEYEVPVEAVLGERLQSVLAAGAADVLAAVAHLKESGSGRCSFILPGVAADHPAVVPAVAEPLLDKVRIATGLQELVLPFLHSVYLVPELALAIELAAGNPRLTFVTPQGDLAYAGGVVDGGSREKTQTGLIHKKREIKELAQLVASLEGSVGQLVVARDQSRADLGFLEEELRLARQGLHQADMALLTQEKDLLRVREEGHRLEERLAVKGMEDDQVAEERSQLEKELGDSEGRRQQAEARKETMQAEVTAGEGALGTIRQAIEAAREAVTVLKVRTAALREKREANLRAIARTENLQKDLRQRIGRLQEELTRITAERELLQEAFSGGDADLRQLLQRQAGAEASCAAIRERYDMVTHRLKEEETVLKGMRGAVDEVRLSVTAASLKLSEINLQRSHLETTLRDKYRLEITAVLAVYTGEDVDLAERETRQAELQKMVDEIGEVNLTAIEEYQELEERFTFLSTQKADLEESLQSLQQAIQRINRTTRQRFQETFHLVNAKFQEVFPRLFCGGRAELRLTNEEDLLETGLDIIVQPPGKKLQNVSLLSGGEKALTAVALIFAIFLIKPSPFCLLDEVDAPLDDANIGRFNEMIREMSAFSQFILITHSKTTMAVADTLYGVTMEVPGVSKLVSVRLQ